jgi:hypothetical protein
LGGNFVGRARCEMKLTNSTSAILMEGFEQQLGGNAVQTPSNWQWQGAERPWLGCLPRALERLAPYAT